MQNLLSNIVNATLLCLLVASAMRERAYADVYASAGTGWSNFVFEPVDQEDTANHYGYSVRGSGGYSIEGVFDLGLYGQYIPGKLNAAEFNREHARLWHAGFEVGAKIAKTLYIGARLGSAEYKLVQRHDPSEVGGAWSGTMTQGFLGMLLPVTKETNWLLGFDLGQVNASLEKAGDASVVNRSRTITQIGISLTFVHNALFREQLGGRFR